MCKINEHELDAIARCIEERIAASEATLDSVGPFRPRSQSARGAEDFLGVNPRE